MTQDELTKVLDIMKDADNGCHVCVLDLLKQTVKAFPEHRDDVLDYVSKQNEYPFEKDCIELGDFK